ncbi:Ig-like domain-containing protein [Aquimonas voraii]|uniref:Ig-like domain (Group 3) n=1 Tax=Aquimonas voraii TaxID=265719 RepID=A0A1G6XNM4_9GAMM|nr:Ig-like domain-containing protein [Aquimonas voraii]SDD78967.1 Ig-like domain (group 3) [Aquimonas voraii]
MSRLRGLPPALLGLLMSPAVSAGAFIFAEDYPDAVTHPQVYSGTGGELQDLTVCLDRSVNSSLTTRAEPAVIKAIETWNRGRSLAADNFALNNATDIGSGYDFESVLLHELGHCQGLNHVNHASESGFNDPQANGSKSAPGANGVLNQAAGSDGIHGSRDDLRGDDVNLHWYLRGQNNPGLFNAIADSSTMARELSFLPSGHRFAANADRSVMAALGFANSEAVMQQGTPAREAKRHLHHDDLMTIRFARSGLNRVQGNSDDYRYRLRYVGRLFNPSNSECNVRIRIDGSTGFAVCGVSASAINNNPDQWRITQAQIAMNSSINWYFSPGPNTVTQISSTSPNPSPVGQNYTVNLRVSEASGISISGNPFGTVEVDDGQGASCSVELTSAMNGQGSCVLPGSSAGSRTLTARYLGRGGFDYSEGSASHAIRVTTSTSITSRQPSATVVGQDYRVNVRVTAASGTPTGSVQVSDGNSSCLGPLSAGSTSCSLPSTSAGTRTLTATYLPTGDFGASSATASHVIGRASTAFATASVQPVPSSHAQPVTVNFTLAAAAPSAATPTGTVTVVAVPGGESCSASVAAGACTLTLFGAGSRSLNLSYAQTPDFNATSTSLPHQVNAAVTSTQIESITPSPVRVGQGYEVAVRVENPQVAPDGGVQVSEGVASCTAVLAGGAGRCRLVSGSAGTRSLQASYAGNGNFQASSASGSQSVQRGATALRVVDIYPRVSPVDSLLQVRWALEVLAPAAGSPGGTVTVTAGPGETCFAPVESGGCALSLGAAGPRSLQFGYAGSADFEPAAASQPHVVDVDALFRSGFEAIEAALPPP